MQKETAKIKSAKNYERYRGVLVDLVTKGALTRTGERLGMPYWLIVDDLEV